MSTYIQITSTSSPKKNDMCKLGTAVANSALKLRGGVQRQVSAYSTAVHFRRLEDCEEMPQLWDGLSPLFRIEGHSDNFDAPIIED